MTPDQSKTPASIELPESENGLKETYVLRLPPPIRHSGPITFVWRDAKGNIIQEIEEVEMKQPRKKIEPGEIRRVAKGDPVIDLERTTLVFKGKSVRGNALAILLGLVKK